MAQLSAALTFLTVRSVAASASAACFDFIPAPHEYFGHMGWSLVVSLRISSFP
jgi:hypothetical protein